MMMRYLNKRKKMRKRIAEDYAKYLEKGSARILNLDEKQANQK